MRKNRSKPLKTTHSKKRLQPLQLQAIGLLSAGQKQIVIVERLGVSSATLNRWLNSPQFVAELDRRIDGARAESERALKCLFSSAVNTIDRLLTDPETPPNVAAQVAFKVLEINLIQPQPVESKPRTLDPEILAQVTRDIYGL